MKLLAALLQGLLLAAPSFSQQKCIKEKDVYYCVYNTSVELKTYYCSYNKDEDYRCTNFNNGKLLTKDPPGLIHDCKRSLSQNIFKLFTFQSWAINFCEVPTRANVLGIVKFPDNIPCLYRSGKCYNRNIGTNAFWTTDTCQRLTLIYHGNFSLWTGPGNIRFIKDNVTRIILTKKILLCGFEMFKTDYEDIMVSERIIQNVKRHPIPNLQSNVEEFCEDKGNDHETIRDVPKTWYVYTYPINTTIHICLPNAAQSCAEIELIESPKNNSALLDQCSSNFCSSSSCPYDSQTVICETTTQVDLENDSLRDLPSQCKYSAGLCKPYKAFWQHTDRCADMHIAFEGYDKQCDNMKCVVQRDGPTELLLLREGKLCGETVWYTDRDGLVVSDKKLRSFKSNKVTLRHPDRWDFSWFRPGPDSDSVETLGIEEYYLIVPLAICLLWILFKIVAISVCLCRRCNKRSSPGLSKEVELRKVRLDRNIQPISDRD